MNSSLLIHTDELSEKWARRMAENGITTLGIHPVGGYDAHITLTELVEKLKTKEYRALIDYVREKGLNVEYEMHAMRYLLPVSEFNAHPEWFRINGEGVRVTDFNCCASNNEALDFIAESAAQLAGALYGSTDRYFFWLDDARDDFCHCERCKSISPSDQQMLILNRIVKRLRQDNPNATLAYLAYCDTIEPPKTILPEAGIFLEYAPYVRDFHSPIQGTEQAAHINALLDFFGKENAKVLDYWYDNSCFSGYTKPPKFFEVDKEVLKADMEYYRSAGFNDISSFACYLGEDYEELHGEPNIQDFGSICKKST